MFGANRYGSACLARQVKRQRLKKKKIRRHKICEITSMTWSEVELGPPSNELRD